MPFEAPFAVLNAKTRRNWVRTALLVAGPVVVVLGALTFYLLGGRYASTDDAYIQAARVQVSANVSARVVEIDVRDNQTVRKGQALVKLDRRPFEIAVEAAEAQLASARLRIATLQAAYARAQADEKAAEDTQAYQQREFDRQSKLSSLGISARAQFDQAQHNLENARQRRVMVAQQTVSALADLGGKPDAPVDSQPGVRKAQAALDQARLNLSYTEIDAPMDGIVTKVEQLQVGDYVNAATPLFALVSNRDLWVEANFKETDLTYMRPGQTVTFDVDSYPGESFTGKVVSLSPGTGSSFSLLPPENASGNWVKVVQRLPVRLSIDKNSNNVPLASGMSVTADVDTRHHRSLAFWK